VRLQEAHDIPEVIVVAVAQYQSIEGRAIDAQQIDVADQRLRGKAEVHENVARLAAPLGFGVHR
jgi:hypothetical protein